MRPLIGIPCAGNLRSPRRSYSLGQRYCRALFTVGCAPILIPLLDDEKVLLDTYQRLDGVLLAGGGDIAPFYFGETRSARLRSVDLPRDRAELFLARQAVADDLPLLAICRGIQILNVALGGTLFQDIPAQIPQALRHDFSPEHPRNYLGHEVSVRPGTRLADILAAERLGVNSFHHQSVKAVPSGLRVAASSPDGVIEAVEAEDKRFIVGVQWHPEELVEDDPRMRRLLEAFVEAARGTLQHSQGRGAVPESCVSE